jgi:hypothetical protein
VDSLIRPRHDEIGGKNKPALPTITRRTKQPWKAQSTFPLASGMMIAEEGTAPNKTLLAFFLVIYRYTLPS